MLRHALAALLLIAVPAQAQQGPPSPAAEAQQRADPWPFAASDLPPDPQYRFGVLDNGMRYIIRPNATPPGRGMVQFWINGGSVDEEEHELGFAHFVEHMAFNGSTNVPEGEMVRLLEREGLSFGADTNASTSFERTLYRLDLPRNDPALLDTALMLMRETASELIFDPEAVERERGVVLAEMRVRDTYALRNSVDQLRFFYPEARFPARLPIGTAETLRNATAEGLKAVWQRLYRPDNTAIIVVGEFDPDAVEQAIQRHFADWRGAPPAEPVDAGPVDFSLSGRTHIHLDPALSERITVARHGEWLGEPDTLAFRQRNVRREIGYAIINRRFQTAARMEDPPFRGAGLGNSEVFKVGRTTNLIVDAGDGEWEAGLAAAQRIYRQALEYGFTEAEVAEQVANLRSALESNAAGAETRGNANFVTGALMLLEEGQVPTTPASALARFEDHLPAITPESVLEALREELIPLDNPLIRFEGRVAPEGGEQALRAAWDAGMGADVAAGDALAVSEFLYDDFGPAGSVVADGLTDQLDIRTLTFANGLRVNLKRTDLQRDRIGIQLHIDGGKMLNTPDNPLATAMVSVLPVGGLGRHTTDELQSIFAGRSVGFAIGAENRTFRMAANTRTRDLELQLQLLAAALSDPGYRPQGEAQYRRTIRDFFARRSATPENALSNALGEIISDGDPRYTLQPIDAYLARDFAQLRTDIEDRLEHGALELAIVGDFDEEETIGMIARTLGALPAREAEFRTYANNNSRGFTAERAPRVVPHDGNDDQALLRMSWPTRDDSDFDEVLRLELLERVMRLVLTDKLREQLGQTYSPGVNATQSDSWPGYGTFNIAAAIDVAQVDEAREAIVEALQSLIATPVDEDILLRARSPMIQAYDNALSTNSGWMNIAWRAQSDPARIGRFLRGKDGLLALTAEDVRATAARYLAPDERLEVTVLPRSVAG